MLSILLYFHGRQKTSSEPRVWFHIEILLSKYCSRQNKEHRAITNILQAAILSFCCSLTPATAVGWRFSSQCLLVRLLYINKLATAGQRPLNKK